MWLLTLWQRVHPRPQAPEVRLPHCFIGRGPLSRLVLTFAGREQEEEDDYDDEQETSGHLTTSRSLLGSSHDVASAFQIKQAKHSGGMCHIAAALGETHF